MNNQCTQFENSSFAISDEVFCELDRQICQDSSLFRVETRKVLPESQTEDSRTKIAKNNAGMRHEKPSEDENDVQVSKDHLSKPKVEVNEEKQIFRLTGDNFVSEDLEKSEEISKLAHLSPSKEATSTTAGDAYRSVDYQFKTVLSSRISLASEIDHSTRKETKHRYNNIEEATMPGIEAVYCPKVIMHDLAEPDFDMWSLDRDSMIDHIEFMFHDLGISRAWKIPSSTLRMFLLGVRERYQDNPYHNFYHCFCVTQMAYSMLCKLRLNRLISVDHMGALLTAAICHDVDHPGLNNSYHCHARTPLAILYNYQSILEQHHFAVTCRILSDNESNIFRNVSNRDEVLTNVGELILATDLARHKHIMEDYRTYIADGFDFKNSDHAMALMKIIIKCADVSNEVRPETVSAPWVERLFAEYSVQSAREKKECLPVTSYMDPEMVNVSESQEGFIRSMMLPMFGELSKLMVEARDYYINPLYKTLLKYEIQNLRARDV